MITAYEKFHEWILNCCNILDFQNVIKLHHNPYHTITDSTYLLKWFIELFFTWKYYDAIDKKEDNFEGF